MAKQASKSRNRLRGAFAKLNAEQFFDFGNRETSRQNHRAVGLLHNVADLLRGLVADLAHNLFDEIFLDVPPALATADAPVVAHKSDGVVLVVRAGGTPREQVAGAVRSLAGAPVWGLVLNGVEPSRVPAPLPVVKGQLTAGK